MQGKYGRREEGNKWLNGVYMKKGNMRREEGAKEQRRQCKTKTRATMGQ